MKSEQNPTMWECSYCNKEFKYESEKRRHEQSHVPRFECKVCSKKFSYLSALRRHEKQHERTGSVQCNKCGGKFRDEILLKRHLLYAHKGTFTCSKCTATFKSEIALGVHMKTHNSESQRKFHCSYHGCGKTFNFTHHLKHHELTHTNSKQHFCNECGKGFIQSHHLKVHQRTHEPDSWLPCPVLKCKKTFVNEYALKRHMVTHKEKTVKKTTLLKGFGRAKEMILCNKCDQLFTQHQYKKHEDSCILSKSKDIFDNSTISYSINEISEVIEDYDTRKQEIDKKGYIENEVSDIEISAGDCKSVLGSCIVTGDSEANDDCLCAQITKKDDNFEDYYNDIVPKDNNVNIKITDDFKCIDKRRKEMNACEGCKCASLCGANKSQEFTATYETPELEYRKDGVIKIKDTFDIDIISTNTLETEDENNMVDIKDVKEFKCSPVNTCKDVLGNCIVSGNGTIGEGCLCAKMIADDQQMIAQEIEEITPCPKNSWPLTVI